MYQVFIAVVKQLLVFWVSALHTGCLLPHLKTEAAHFNKVSEYWTTTWSINAKQIQQMLIFWNCETQVYLD